MTRRSGTRTTTVRKYRVEASDIDALQRIGEANDLSQQETITRLIAFAASVKDDVAVAYVLGLVPRSLKPVARERLAEVLKERDG